MPIAVLMLPSIVSEYELHMFVLFRQQDLLRVLKAYTLHRPEEGYCQAQAPIAAVLLMHMPAEVTTHSTLPKTTNLQYIMTISTRY